jgi:O-antigen/teichoic acid export membrane protein
VASQGDRWVLAAIATPAFLAKYDFALRLAAVPLGLAVTLFHGLTSESAALRESRQRHRLLVTAIHQASAIIIVTSIATLGGVLALLRIDILSVDLPTVILTCAALLWMGTNAVTAVATYTYLGAGRPWAELAYSIPCAVTLATGWITVAALHAPLLLIVVNAGAVSGWSLWYLRQAARDPRL